MANANPESSDLLILVIVLGCVVGILVLALTVTCACLCRHQMANKKTRAAKSQNKKKSMTEANKANGQNVDDSRPKEMIDDEKVKSSLAYFYHKPDAETQQIVTRVQINDNNYNPNRFTTSAANDNWSAGYQPTLPWPRIALSGTAATSNYERWNPTQDGRVVLNAAPWSVQQGSSVVPVSVCGGNQSSGFRSTQAERVVLNAVDGCNGQEGTRQATVLYPRLS